MKHCIETGRAIAWCFALFWAAGVSAAETPQGPAAVRLNLAIIEGEGAINNIQQRTTRETIVQVEDENHKPVAGAAVVFLLPGDGPGGAFLNRAKSATTVTNSSGQATLPRLQTNQLVGQFRIRVTASYQNRQGSAEITQTNVAGAAGLPLAHAGISAKAIGIIVGVAVAGAAGAAVGLRGGSKSAPMASTPLPSAAISLGSGLAIGPPH